MVKVASTNVQKLDHKSWGMSCK